jgi:hypothetical protein
LQDRYKQRQRQRVASVAQVAFFALGDQVFVAIKHLERNARFGACVDTDNVPDVKPCTGR